MRRNTRKKNTKRSGGIKTSKTESENETNKSNRNKWKGRMKAEADYEKNNKYGTKEKGKHETLVRSK